MNLPEDVRWEGDCRAANDEIKRLRTNENLSTLQYNWLLAKYELAESRLAAANALLREALNWTLKYPEAGTRGATTLCRKLQSHLQGAGDEA